MQDWYIRFAGLNLWYRAESPIWAAKSVLFQDRQVRLGLDGLKNTGIPFKDGFLYEA